ncbi:hypothetical protein CGLAU_01215 [Corynebacterium glaucum]|uniref:WXG domain conatining protein n=1 Tax=Corynebacterium glaucum TaxID=187491 RepID=A0A1Q2HTR5_9CORY|nr:WXG100 family type VII secretion target [Corynebacterium glaucum]AQQ14234.1 hypothetical protein CGLAU_01215 [Corynebacterium glaucum]WJZ06757.1 WXG domain conatining protein [Corynebacterium glaucum]
MSQSNELSVEHSAVATHISSLQENHTQLTDQAKQFITAIEPLKNSWKGASVGAWENMTNAWSENMEMINQALGTLTGRVDDAGQQYQSGEQEQTDELQQAFAGMNFQSGPIL